MGSTYGTWSDGDVAQWQDHEQGLSLVEGSAPGLVPTISKILEAGPHKVGVSQAWVANEGTDFERETALLLFSVPHPGYGEDFYQVNVYVTATNVSVSVEVMLEGMSDWALDSGYEMTHDQLIDYILQLPQPFTAFTSVQTAGPAKEVEAAVKAMIEGMSDDE